MKNLIANGLRYLSAKMVEDAKSGHPGMPLGFADAMVSVLKQINFDNNDPDWINRDRLILSCGHGSALLYSCLFGFGILNKEDLKNFRQINSKTPGHPELSKGIDLTTGPLGQGFAWGIGMALAERISNAKYGEIINHNTYIICSDGDLMEGISYEAAAIAGNYNLNKLIVLWDNNKITIDGTTELSTSENMQQRFEAAGWNFLEVDGNDSNAVENAIIEAKTSNKPNIISCKTQIGKFSSLEDSPKAHGAPLGKESFEDLAKKLNYDEQTFLSEFEKISQNAKRNKEAWDAKWQNHQIKKDIKVDFNAEDLKEDLATRKHSENILKNLIEQNDNLIIASADLAKSCGTWPSNGKLISKNDYNGNILPCGIREHAMVAITGGITQHGILKGIASTFLSFYDYARPAVRLAALMETPLIMIATHDSINLGEDGPTHQPIEHLDSLRSMPNLNVFRPADGIETLYCYKEIMKAKIPSILVLSREKLNRIHSLESQVMQIKFEENLKNGIIISTGSQAYLAKTIAENTKKAFLSVPLFSKEKLKEIKSPAWIIEASSALIWNYFIPQAKIFNIETFGKSGKEEDMKKEFGFTQETLTKWVKNNS